ncbi:MAG: dTMP kinase [Candidatus Saccharimonadales bacterium]
MPRGKYIVIEGHDGTGKSTQVARLRKYLAARNIESIEFHEPEDTTLPITSELRSLIKNGTVARRAETNLLLFTAVRHEIWHASAELALANGTWIIASRSYLSTLVYQGYGEGLSLDLIRNTTETFTSKEYMQPDASIILTIDSETTRQSRISSRDSSVKADTFEQRDSSFQQRITNGYHELSTTLNIPTVSASGTKQAVHERIIAALQKQVGEL